MNCQQDITPVSVTFRHSKPECSYRYYEHFKSPVLFDSPSSSLVLPLDIMDKTLPSGNKEMAGDNEHLTTRHLATIKRSPVVPGASGAHIPPIYI